MTFDITTAKPEKKQGFDLTTAQPLTADKINIEQEAQAKIQALQADIDKLKQARANPDLLEQIFGGVEGFLALGSGFVAPVAAGLEGIGETIATGDPIAGAERAKQVQQELTFQPRLDPGKGAVQDVAETLEPVTEGLKEVREEVGEGAFEATGSPFLASIATALPDATLSLFGIRGVRGQPRLPGQTGTQAAAQQRATAGISEQGLARLSESDRAIAQLILEKSDDVSTATKKLSTETLRSKLIDGLPRIVKDKVAQRAINQGLSEQGAAIIKALNPTEKAKIRQMIGTAERALKSGTAQALDRVGDVVGKTLLDRVQAVAKINRQAGANIDKVAKSQLTGKTVDASPAVRRFADDLKNMRVTLDNGRLKFKGSDIEGGVKGAKTAQNILKLTAQRLNQIGAEGNALKLHELKRFIDKQVQFGKDPSGAAGAAESVLKNLRREIDTVLDNNFQAYKTVNDKFAQTRTALDNFQQAAGTSIDFSSQFAAKGLGTKMRSLTSNNLTRSRLLNAMSELEDILVNNGVKFKDRILEQAVIANELESLLKLTPKTSFKGQVAEGVIDATTGQPVQAAVRTGKAATEKIRGKTPEKALQAIKDLLKGGN